MIKRIVSAVIILTLLFTPVLGIVHAEEPADEITLNGLSNATVGSLVTISGTTTLAEVGIKVVHPNKTIVFMDAVKASGGSFSTSFSLSADAAAGSYTVVAGRESTVDTKTLIVTALPPTQLAAPSKPSLANRIATWAATANENNGYRLKLYKDGSLIGTVNIAHGAVLTYDFSTAMTEAGSYTVTVTALGSANYCDSEESEESAAQVLDKIIAVTGITINKQNTSIITGSSETLVATVTPAEAKNKEVIWSSSNAAVAEVDNNGKVTGVSAGSAIITATTKDGGKTAFCTVTVTKSNIAVSGVSLDKSSIGLFVGNSYTLAATVIPANASNKAIAWSSSNPAVAAVNGNGSITAVAAGTAAITVTAVDGGHTASCTVTVSTAGGDNGGGNGNNNGNSSGGNSDSTSAPAGQTYQAVVSGTDTTSVTLPVNVNANTGTATVELGSISGNIFSNVGTTIINAPPIPGIDNYSLGAPVAYLSIPGGEGTLTFTTNKGSMILPTCMLEGINGAEGKKAEITIGKGDKSSLPINVKTAIGDRPLVQLSLKLDGVPTEWNNPDAPVKVSIPYTPTAEELRNPESIIIWYIDGSGKAASVPNGHYDSATHTVTFSTTHFSYYAVGFNKLNFKDVPADSWYNKAVGFVAARGITAGTGAGSYSPVTELTRGQYMVMVMKAYGIMPDKDSKDNFRDAGNTYYTDYLAGAKRLGISAGTGNNMFAPDKKITRQEMFAILYNTLKAIGELPEGNSGEQLSAFNDAEQIASWAKDAMSLFVKTGIISGNDRKLAPASTTTRAEMAQVLYNLLAK